MRVKEIRVYPIKSIRGIKISTSLTTTAAGFDYDRIFMLQRVEDSKNMHVPHFPSMCLFTTELSPSPDSGSAKPEKVLVRFGKDHTFDQPEKKLPSEEEVLEVPLEPDVKDLEQVKVLMHSSTTMGLSMPAKINKWFSDRFGFDVRLLYIGHNRREVLGNLSPLVNRSFVGDQDPGLSAKDGSLKHLNSSAGWLGGVKAGVGSVLSSVASYAGAGGALEKLDLDGLDEGLRWSDVAAFLVVSDKSYEEVVRRIGEDVDIEKFRPNLVIEGAPELWDEDYWGELSFGRNKEVGIVMTSNCARCASLNVDYNTGKPGEGPVGNVLKCLQSDRRVDPGTKYSPIFGRYGFLATKNGTPLEKPATIRVGDEVELTKKYEKRTWQYWPGIGTYKNQPR